MALFPKLFSQNREYLAAPWSDFSGTRPRWSSGIIVCDSEGERSRKILQRENDWGQGRRVGPKFWGKRQPHEANRILAALPGAERREGAQPPRVRSHMACRDGEQRSVVLQQHFIAQRWANRAEHVWRTFQKYFH